MGDQAKMVVEKGPDTGKSVTVPPDGLRIGRSSRNDMVLLDPALSRFHCRVYPVPGQGLFVADLGSSNDTCVNGKPIQEVRLHVDDRIAIGETVLRVVDDGMQAPVPAGGHVSASGQEPLIDLGLRRDQDTARPVAGWRKPSPVMRLALAVLLGLLIVILLAGLIWRDLPRQDPPPPALPPPPPVSLNIVYEKIEAGTDNIFRYHLTLDDLQLALEIDDLANNRQVRKQTMIDRATVRDLAATIETSGFSELMPDYSGLSPDVYDRSEIQVTIGRRTHRTVVFNRVAPDAFNEVRERIEIMAQNELGTAALALSPEQLLAMAEDAYLLGRSLYDERALRHENLYRAIRAFREVEWYLDTIEPKPGFYAEAVARRQQTERDLQERIRDLEFLAERAIKGSDWNEAASHFRTILDTIPERSDERHRRTVTRLLDVERRIGRGM